MSASDARLERLFGDGATAFRAAFDLVPDPVGLLWAIRDRSGAVADFLTGYSNPAMARMIGVPIEASIGRRLLADAPEFSQDEAYQRMRGVLESGRPEVVEVSAEAGDGPIGRVRGVFLHRAIPFGADGVMNLVTDVTEQRRMEDELRNYAKVAAHDLREPIMAAGYFVELLARRIEHGRTAENEELIESVRQVHARARSLVDGVLEYARSGTSLAADAVDTGELMADVAASLANAVERLHGRVEVSELPVVCGDRAQLARVFQNLVANGLKFYSDQPPRIAVSAERREASWLFSVQDNGVGVPPELGDDIFSMFKRAHGEEIEGSGIGLAVPQDRRSARRRHLGGAGRRCRHRDALHRSRRPALALRAESTARSIDSDRRRVRAAARRRGAALPRSWLERWGRSRWRTAAFPARSCRSTHTPAAPSASMR
jgi:signal transduction histidine kinase